MQPLKSYVNQHAQISLAILFGSCAKGNPGPDSDVDIAIQWKGQLNSSDKINLIQEIAQLTGRPVDLVDLNTVGQPLLSQIIRYGKVIKGSREAYVQLAIKNVNTNEDFMPYVRRSLPACMNSTK